MSARDIKVRMAHPDEGPVIGELEGMKFANWEMDWSEIDPGWLVAEMDGRIVGAIQVSPGKPFGRLESMAVAKDLGSKERAVAVRDLCYAALATLRTAGCQAAIGMVQTQQPGFKQVAEHRGCFSFAEGDMMIKRLV
jgi:hypothetical protein